MALYQFGDTAPRLEAGTWVADNATVLGNVTLAEGASVWYGAVLRGDNERIAIGRHSNVQDGCVLHTDIGEPLDIGDDVTVGHLVMLHGCTVGSGSLIGMHSVVLNGARIGRHCLVGAGSLVTTGKTFPDGMLIVGRPAKVVRELSAEEVAGLARSAQGYVLNAARHRQMAQRVG